MSIRRKYLVFTARLSVRKKIWVSDAEPNRPRLTYLYVSDRTAGRARPLLVGSGVLVMPSFELLLDRDTSTSFAKRFMMAFSPVF
jgi:hypothetical protein